MVTVRKIIACCLTFNAANLIEASLNSVVDLVDYVVVVDGAFLGYPDSNDNSQDGTIELARQIVRRKGIVITPPCRLTQPQKQNFMLRYATKQFPDAWTFMIENDEILHDADEEFDYLRSKSADKYCVAMIRRNDASYNRMYGFQSYAGIRDRTPFHPRLYSRIPGLHYAENHWTVRDQAGDRVEPKYPSISLRHAWLDHARSRRPIHYLEGLNYYETYERWKYERVMRPLKSYVPYPVIRTAKRVLRRGGLNVETAMNWVYTYTLGSQTRRERSK